MEAASRARVQDRIVDGRLIAAAVLSIAAVSMLLFRFLCPLTNRVATAHE